MTYFTNIRGFIGAVALGASSFFGTLFFLWPAVPLVFIPRLHFAFRLYTDFFVSAWLTYAIAIMRIFHGVNIITHGDPILRSDKALIVMNHRTRLDWFYFWSTAMTDGFLFDLKIALKRALKRMPGAGWAQQLAGFLFLDRRAEFDLPRISAYLSYLASFRDRPFKLLVFPEGTDLCDNSKMRSDSFADKSGLPRYEYVLHPRTTGVDLAFDTLSKLDALDAIYDVTIAYEGPFPCSELAIISGDLPQTVRFFIRRYPARYVAERGSTKFWQEIWQQKEQFLDTFYNGKSKRAFAQEGRSEGTFETFLEWTALICWTLFLLYVFVVVLPAHWLAILFASVGMWVWSELVPDGIDGTVIKFGNKR